jgi:hypothetical protein
MFTGQAHKEEEPMQPRKSQSRSYWQKLLDRLKRLFRPRPKPEPEDPYAYRTAPLRHPPHGRSGAAVAELDDEE